MLGCGLSVEKSVSGVAAQMAADRIGRILSRPVRGPFPRARLGRTRFRRTRRRTLRRPGEPFGVSANARSSASQEVPVGAPLPDPDNPRVEREQLPEPALGDPLGDAEQSLDAGERVLLRAHHGLPYEERQGKSLGNRQRRVSRPLHRPLRRGALQQGEEPPRKAEKGASDSIYDRWRKPGMGARICHVRLIRGYPGRSARNESLVDKPAAHHTGRGYSYYPTLSLEPS